MLIILVIGLLGYAKQLAKNRYRILPRSLCMQVIYRLAPTFFLMESLNLDLRR
ncbi:MAG: hypothetical protein LBJ57_01370 [Prevotellaceae bacterium]|nr:hypothetical protein [Prevotellaceae bacterium]